MTEITIRPYQRRDRQDVRRISGDTANLGKPLETFFRDREVLIDLLMDYYLDYEPESCWVAEQEGKAVGYLCGCLHPTHYRFIMIFYILPKTLGRALWRGVFCQPETWRLLGAAATTFWKGGYFKGIPFDQYPVHLHINLQMEFRNQRIGPRLMEHFLNQVKAAGRPGVHAVTREQNKRACRFFEKMGFTVLSRHHLVVPAPEGPIYGYTVVYGKIL